MGAVISYKKILASWVVLVGVGLYQNAMASPVTTGWQKLSSVRTGWDSEKVILVAPSVPNPAGCSTSTIAVTAATASNKDQVLSIALSALASDRDVRFTISDFNCESNVYPRVMGIEIR